MSRTRYAKLIDGHIDIKSTLGFLCPEGYTPLPEGNYIDSEVFYEGGRFQIDEAAMNSRLALEELDKLRSERNKRLTDCDYTQLADAPLNSIEKQAWRDYRQALRDITASYSNLNDVIWPSKPE